MTFSSDRVLQHIETQAYNVLDAYFNNEIPITVQVGGGGMRAGVREHALFIDKQFSEIMAGGGCDDVKIVENPNTAFSPPFEAAALGNTVVDVGMSEIPVNGMINTAWPYIRR
jgi:hypothetical protein